MSAPVYFDHNATTPLEPAVFDAMLPWLSRACGNASSRHDYGRAARRAIDEARGQVAAAIGAHPTEVIFTSGGSEANNLLLKGAASCLTPGLLAVSAIEHPCVIKPAEQLVGRGWRLHKIAVDGVGRVDAQDYQALLAQRPKLVSVMSANNETGVLQDVATLAAQAKACGALFHTDAAQAVGKVAVDFRRLNAVGVAALTFSAHKIGGPQGAAALVLDKRVDIEPQIAGGGHERGLRSGTENVAAIVGFGAACALLEQRLAAAPLLSALRDQLAAGLRAIGATLFGETAERLPNTLYFALPGVDGETLVGALDRAGFALASGAACSSANPEPSHVLRAMGVASELARGALRVSFGRGNTAAQVIEFLTTLQGTLRQLQRLTALAV